MNLVQWHDKLHMHFQELCQERTKVGGFVFVLEHGLSQTEVEQLEADIRAYIQKKSPADQHWLPWIVYAAELGYKYVGLEYWQTFEASTVGWREYGLGRDWVRNKFKKFERDYHGAEPSGPWAQNFNIICHPITHAILPKDFQSQLAEVLYTIRHLFTLQNLQSAELLGKLIASHSLHQSKRFQKFVQDEQIVGLIAKALLNQEESQTHKILHPSTLHRIVTDLGSEGVALDQLRDACRSAQVTQLRGLSIGSRSDTISYSSRTSIHDSVTIGPRFVLRRIAPTSWETLIEIPDFTPLLDKCPTWRPILEQTRVAVSGSRIMLVRGRLLYGTVAEVQLHTFPEVGRPMLRLENEETPDELKQFIEKNFSLNADATILCRIASDGRAYQSRGLLVRPGRSYLVLNSEGPVRISRFTTGVDTTCEGLHAAQLSVPETITLDCKTLIEKLGLKIARQISVFPAGFAAAKWDNEGQGEWLTTDEPCIGVHLDYQVDTLLFKLDKEEKSSLEVHPKETEQSVFVQMPPLSKGHHKLFVSARVSTNDEYEEVGQLQILIREPRSWKLAINGQGALIAIVEPRKPTIEQLMRGAISIELYGPSGHQMQVTATFFGKDSTILLPPYNLPNLCLPINFLSGRVYLAKLSKNLGLQSALDSAHSCRIDFDAGELGTFSFICEREFTPLRWNVESNTPPYLLSLLDDSGDSKQAFVTRYDFSRPDLPIPMSHKQPFVDHVVPPFGGLYLAHRNETQCSIIFPPEITGNVRTFADLSRTFVEPQFQSCQPSVENLQDALTLFTIWAESRTTGSMVVLAQRRVLQEYIAHIFSIIGGSKWAASERAYRSDPYHPNAALKLCKTVVEVQSIGQNLLHQCETMKDATPKEHVRRLAEVISFVIKPVQPTHRSSTIIKVTRGGPWQAEFALRLASAPETVKYWARDWYIPGLKGLLENTVLARAARFVVLTTSHYLQTRECDQHISLYPGWNWI